VVCFQQLVAASKPYGKHRPVPPSGFCVNQALIDRHLRAFQLTQSASSSIKSHHTDTILLKHRHAIRPPSPPTSRITNRSNRRAQDCQTYHRSPSRSSFHQYTICPKPCTALQLPFSPSLAFEPASQRPKSRMLKLVVFVFPMLRWRDLSELVMFPHVIIA
jgi:hypothetical protein